MRKLLSTSPICTSLSLFLAVGSGLGLLLSAEGVARADAATYVYFRCNATGWGADSTTRMRDTGTPGVVALEFDVATSWMTTSGDDCELTQTDMLDGWGTQTRYYAFAYTGYMFQVPGTQQTSLVSGRDPHFKVRYPSLGHYRARFDRNTLKLTIDTGTPEVPTVVIRDLGGMNIPVISQTASGVFQITGFPAVMYNVVTLVIEARDGKPLSGELGSGGSTIPLSGTSQTIRFRERGTIPVVFQLAFPESRKVALTWYVENRVPAAKAVPQTTVPLGIEVVAEYDFPQDHALKEKLALTLSSNAFADGNVPTFTRLEHNPQGVRYPDRPDDLFGPTYNIQGNLKPGASVQIALPAPEVTLLRGLDENALTVMHYHEATKTWSEIIPDHIAGGYVYFTVDSFSNFFTRIGKAIKQVVSTVAVAVAGPAVKVYDTVVTVIDGVTDTVKQAYMAFVAGACSSLGIDTYIALLFSKPTFQAPQADLTDIVMSQTDFPLADLTSWDAAENLIPLSSAPGSTAADIEANEWELSRQNAMLLLNDILLSAKTTRPRRFSLSGSPGAGYVITDTRTALSYTPLQIFRFTSALLASIPRVFELLIQCGGMVGTAAEYLSTLNHFIGFIKNGTRFDLGAACENLLMLPAEYVGWTAGEGMTCETETASFLSYASSKNLVQYWTGTDDTGRDEHFLNASGFFNVFSVLLWADARFKSALTLEADSLRDELHSFTGMFHDAYGNNNIVIKAMAGVSLWDMLSKGDKGTYGKLRSWLEDKTGTDGGYSEGTGYLQYVNDDVPYVLSVMLRAGFIQRADLPQKYLKTAEWLFLSSNNRTDLIPAEVDDGLVHRPDYLVYSFLSGDGRYASLKAPSAPSESAFRAMGVTSAELPVSAPPVLPNVSFLGGIGVVRATVGATTASISVIAESDFLREAANAHDQQDNTSVAMKRGAVDVIKDPGYGGFGDRKQNKFPRFENHNVVMRKASADFHGERANGMVTVQDVMDVLRNVAPGVHADLSWIMGTQFEPAALLSMQYVLGNLLAAGITWPALVTDWSTLKDLPLGDVEGHAGGANASLSGVINDLAAVPSYGLEVVHTSTAGVTNRRMVLTFADHFWIIDRPEALETLWSRLNWEGTAYLNAFHIPQTELEPPVHVAIKQNEKDPAGNDIIRTMVQVTRESGPSAGFPPIFVTAVPVEDVASSFQQSPCASATCMRRTADSGAVDMVIVPNWGQPFVDGGQFFGTGLVTGKVILAHRNPGATRWSYRLVGAEGAYTSEYIVEPGPLTWLQARDACAARGAHLVTIESQAENDRVRSLVPGYLHVWIGLSRQTGYWQWVDGAYPYYTKWASGEPNNYGGNELYVEMRPLGTGTWNDLPNAWQLPYVCERN